jgi:hypothetical protein
MYELIIVLLLSSNVYADMNECSKRENQDDKNYCLASYAGSATFCDKIKNYGRRNECIRMVIAKQRSTR